MKKDILKKTTKNNQKRNEILRDCFECIRAMRRDLIRDYEKNLSSKEKTIKSLLTHAQIGTLFLFEQENVQNTKEIANRLHVSSSAATQLINKLVEDKLLSRSMDTVDRRKVCLSLTLKGKIALTELKKEHIKKIGKMFETLSNSELVTFVHVQKKVINSWKKTT